MPTSRTNLESGLPKGLGIPIRGARWVVYRVIGLICRLARVRVLDVHAERIGHLAIEPDAYLKDVILGQRSRRGWQLIIYPRDRVANQCLLNYWRRAFTVVTRPWLCELLLRSIPATLHVDLSEYATALGKTAGFYAVDTQWGNRPPLLKLSSKDRERGYDCLARLGVPPGAWFVCVHCREDGYAPDAIHRYRDAHIGNMSEAIGAITARGGWCIRVGDATAKPMDDMPRTIDYAHSDLKSDWMDVFLLSECRFLLGNTSGPFLVAAVFGTPCALVNITPISVMGCGPNDLCIPKLNRSDRDSRYLSFAESFGSDVSNFRFTPQFEEHQIRPTENTPEEIRDLVVEMMQRLDGRARYSAKDDSRQRQYLSLLRPGHYGHGSSSRIGRDFLRKHRDLLESSRNAESREERCA